MAAIAAGAAGAAGGIDASDYIPSAGAAGGSDDAAREAIEALTALGYSRAEASKAVRACKENAAKNGTDPGDTESILKAALRYL
jgi:Holliday junction resolvasome RuvABC DNA-binding subunit